MNYDVIYIDIPFIKHKLNIYIGSEGRTLFDHIVEAKYPEWDGDIESDGMHYENYIFVEDTRNSEVLFHEISHFLDWLYGKLNCQYESEFKACLMAHVMSKYFRIITSCRGGKSE